MASIALPPSTTAPHELSSPSSSSKKTNNTNTNTNTTTTHAPPAKKADTKPHDVSAVFNYYRDPGDGTLPSPNYAGQLSSFTDKPIEPRTLPVHDIRGSEHAYTLDRTGFQVVGHESREKDFVDDDEIKEIYYPEVEQILKETTGASKVFIFDHTIRRPAANSSPQTPEEAQHAAALRGPVQRVHIDQSYAAAPARVRHHLPDEAAELLRGRFQIINVWRPIKAIYKDPLGVADANSVADADLVPLKLIYPDREGETYTVKANDAHRWHYLYGQRPDEVLLIKCFDSKLDGRARRVAHSAFENPEHVNDAPRESIEVRTLVFHPDDTA
ncbi:MAG: hypothetical protein M1819_003884 [Sarea resinae]|nr:MAG: hypothetical protein M1819_003884 [Sarea resinae]